MIIGILIIAAVVVMMILTIMAVRLIMMIVVLLRIRNYGLPHYGHIFDVGPGFQRRGYQHLRTVGFSAYLEGQGDLVIKWVNSGDNWGYWMGYRGC